MIRLVSNNKNIKGSSRNRLTCQDHYTSGDCRNLFDGDGYIVLDNSDVPGLYESFALILTDGTILYDWTLEERPGGQWMVVAPDGIDYDEDEIVYEVHPDKLAEHRKVVKLECLTGGKESEGLEVLRANMRNYKRLAVKLDGDRQRRNRKVK